eukprot:TRINITY_DN3742_c0_g1_i1.p1 TRINITY_DN3742_c0_g1~~TRINITY_DN3742_c0_g1_i1.p1  ORF type:complete len:254 (-),score=27.89 TRINITY_DN3742_c0_g1_i1:402-1163(-)
MGAFRHIPSTNLHVSKPTWWLESRFHFSFANYYNPANTEFGVLRVLNDDLVKPHSGFGTHPHRDMEIVTYVLNGELTHKDSMGTSESLGRGSIQYMSAGTGITHSEMNAGDKLLRFLQIWIKPNARGLKPNYGSRVLKESDRRNQFQHLLTSFDNADGHLDMHTGVVPIHQDTNMYCAEVDAGKTVNFSLAARRQAYVVCMEGQALVNEKEVTMGPKDAMEVVAPRNEKLPMTFTADNKQGAFIFIIEMAQKT